MDTLLDEKKQLIVLEVPELTNCLKLFIKDKIIQKTNLDWVIDNIIKTCDRKHHPDRLIRYSNYLFEMILTDNQNACVEQKSIRYSYQRQLIRALQQLELTLDEHFCYGGQFNELMFDYERQVGTQAIMLKKNHVKPKHYEKL